jgi:hypothetical protein
MSSFRCEFIIVFQSETTSFSGAHTKRRKTKRRKTKGRKTKRRHDKTSPITKRRQLQNVEFFSALYKNKYSTSQD